MADAEHFAILGRGVEAWNSWRARAPGTIPDLSNACLIEANLPAADLSKANLRLANLSCANLSNVNLRAANLYQANLYQADLRGAILKGADISEAILTGANLSCVDLRFAYLTAADLSEANLDSARLQQTVLSNTNLSGVKGLQSCRHEGESVLDRRTLQRSGMLSVSFLRGCGLPEDLIEKAPLLRRESGQFYSCFISYCYKDDPFARRVHADLQGKGVQCWFAPQDMRIGEKIREAIDIAIRVRDKVLLILSKSSVESEWIKREIEAAFEEERARNHPVLLPIRIDDAVMESGKSWATEIRQTRHIGDFTRWKDHDSYRKAFDRLLRDLEETPPKEDFEGLRILPHDEEGVLDWDASVEAPPPHRSGTISVKLVYRGRSKAIAITDPWAE